MIVTAPIQNSTLTAVGESLQQRFESRIETHFSEYIPSLMACELAPLAKGDGTLSHAAALRLSGQGANPGMTRHGTLHWRNSMRSTKSPTVTMPPFFVPLIS